VRYTPVEEPDIVSASRWQNALPKVQEWLLAVHATEGRQGPASATARGLIDRAVCWLRTLSRFEDTSHYQAYLAALRAMIEITVDLGLLCIDPTRNAHIEAWEASEQYKHAAAFARGSPTDSRAEFAKAFADRERDKVMAFRSKYWKDRKGKPTHPTRWTGQTLGADVKKVDEKYPAAKISRFYDDTYQYACWSVHGSGLVAARSIDKEQLIAACGLSLVAASDLGFVCAEFALRLFGAFDLAKQIEHTNAQTAWRLAYGGWAMVDGKLVEAP
jgi:hypothetical protein